MYLKLYMVDMFTGKASLTEKSLERGEQYYYINMFVVDMER